MITARAVVKTFGQFAVLKGVNLQVEQGEFVTLLGPNGAGKTTFLRILAMLSRPTSGVVEIAGVPLTQARPTIRSLIGVISHLTFLYDDLTATENLNFYGSLYGIEKKELRPRIEYLLDRVGLARRADQRVRFFSRGMQQRLSLARAVLHQPPVLLLDEPDTGLDRQAAEMLTGLLAEPTADGSPRTVLMTTHNLERGLAMSSRVVVLAAGKITADLPASHLTADTIQGWYYEALARRKREASYPVA